MTISAQSLPHFTHILELHPAVGLVLLECQLMTYTYYRPVKGFPIPFLVWEFSLDYTPTTPSSECPLVPPVSPPAFAAGWASPAPPLLTS